MKKNFLLFAVLVFIVNYSIGQNLDYDREQGVKASLQIAQQMGVDTTSTTAAYIAAVGNRLVDNLENQVFEYKFHLVDAEEPNAFALPGGYIYITRGILLLLNNEDELAGIVGHEIIHAHNRHSYHSFKKSILPTILKTPGNVISLVNEDFGKLINAPLELGSSLQLAKYSRKHETEADTEGIKLAALAGYDPLSLASALSNMKKDVEYLTGEEEKFGYFDDHPYTPKRIDNIKSQSKQMVIEEQSKIVQSTKDFLYKLQGIYIGQNPEVGFIKENHFLHSGLNLDLTFPEGWRISKNPSYIASVRPDKKAQVYILIESANGEKPEVMGRAFIEKFREKNNVESYRAEELIIKGRSAFRFSVDELGRKGEVTNSTIFWIKRGNLIYRVVGSGDKKYEKDFVACAMSLQGLDEKSRAQISGVILKVEAARDKETLKEFSKRTRNTLNMDFLALINDIDIDSQLSEGQLLKIGIFQLYMPGS